ncbi:hypothetical protein Leryth_010758 [Lithospermum erythrorhizon]|nr:hypothetical protein Leryth_010758 [Lithospermum erythrorhizon]
MAQPGPPNPPGGLPSIQHSLLRSNSSIMAGQGSAIGSHIGFSSMASPRTQFGNVNMLGNVPNVSSMVRQSFPSGASNTGLPGSGNLQRGLTDNGAEMDPLSGVGNGSGFNQPSSSLIANTSGQVQAQHSNMLGNQMLTDPQQSQQLDPRNFQHNHQQLLVPNSNQQPQEQFQTMRAGIGAAGPVKMEPHDQTWQQLQTLRNLNNVKVEPQLQGMRSPVHVKTEPQHSDQSMFLQQQQQQQQHQQQQFLQLSRQNPHAAAMFQQQRFIQLQQQQQNILKAMPPQRSPLQSQFPSQNLPMRSPVKPIYEPGTCARRLTHYMYQQQHRPEDNNIEFWRKFVAEFFAPNAKKKWCVSMYGSGRQTTGVFPQDVWHCEICNRKPGRGFEATVEVLPRLFKIKYESGTLEELLYVDMPREYQNSSGQIVLDYAKAIQQSIFEQLRVVRDGQLRLVFSSDLKLLAMYNLEAVVLLLCFAFRLQFVLEVNQLGAAVQKYQATTQNSTSNPSVSDLQNNCNLFVSSARQLSKALEVPLVNDLGYTKRYVRCLQISEVVNSMKDLIDYSGENTIGPMESLAKIPRKSNSSPGFCSQRQRSEDQLQQPQQQAAGQNSNNDLSAQNPAMKFASRNGVAHVNGTLNTEPAGSSASTIASLMHQNSINSRQQNLVNGSSSPRGAYGVQMPSPGSIIQQSQANLSPFHSPSPSTTNHLPHASNGAMSAGTHNNSAGSPNVSIQQPAVSGDVDGTGSLGNDAKISNATFQTNNNQNLSGSNGLIENGEANVNGGIGGTGFGSMSNGLVQSTMANAIQVGLTNNSMSINGRMGNGLGQSTMLNGIHAGLANNSTSMNGRMGVALARNQSMNQRNQMLSGLGTINGYNNLQFN